MIGDGLFTNPMGRTTVAAVTGPAPAAQGLKPLGLQVVAVVAITVLGAALRLYHLGFKSLWFDEAALFWMANGSWGDILRANAQSNSAPPLFALLLGLVVRVGTSEVALRGLSCAAGIAAIPAMYLLAKRFVPARAAGLAALVVAIAPQQIRYSQQVREYSLAFLVAVLLLLAFDRFRERASAGRAAALAAVGAVGIFTQYGLALLVGGLGVVYVGALVLQSTGLKSCAATSPVAGLKTRATARTGGAWRGVAWFVAANLVMAAAAVAVYQLSLRQQFVAGGFGASPESTYLSNGYWNGSVQLLAGFIARNTRDIFHFAFPGDVALLVCAIGIVAALRSTGSSAGLQTRGSDRAGAGLQTRGTAAVLLLAVPFLVALLAGMLRMYPYVGDRQAMFLMPMIYVVLAIGLAHLWTASRDRTVPCLVALLVFAHGGTSTLAHLQSVAPVNLRPVVSTLVALLQPTDTVYVDSGGDPVFRYYTRSSPVPYMAGVYSPLDLEPYCEQARRLAQAPGRVWLVFSHTNPRDITAIVGELSRTRRVASVRADVEASLLLAETLSRGAGRTP
jgi:4-amino-4-deoxy-L-arabinose transferase-like glycosyltransferase